MPSTTLRYQQGFILLISLIMLIVVAVVSSYLVNFYGLQQTNATRMQRLLQAEYAAQSGMQWALYNVWQQQAQHLQCNQPSPAHLHLPGSRMADFRVEIECTSVMVQENAQAYPVYRLTVTAQTGRFTSSDFVSHQVVEVVKVCC